MTQFIQPSTPEELLSLGPIDPVENPYDIFKVLRESSPVCKVGDTYYISSFELASQALLDDETFSSKSNSPDYPGIGMVFGQTIVGMNGPEHLKHKNLITPALRPRAPGADFALTEATIGLNALLDRLQDLRFDPAADEVSIIHGVAFRGPSHLKVLFNT